MKGTINAKRAKSVSGKRFILTCAQNNTRVHKKFWENLTTYAKKIDATIKVSRLTYNKASNSRSSKVNSKKQSDYDGLWYDPCLVPYFSDDRERLAPGLIWCGDTNTPLTQQNPLGGRLNYLGEDSIILPHPKLAMESVPGVSNPKFCYTTGAVTLRNYIQMGAGQKADFHHCYGALIVEIDNRGVWFVRQLNATSTGEFYDIHDGAVDTIYWGDTHVAQLDPVCKKVFFGKDGVLDYLKPKYQIHSDIFDAESINHHDQHDAIKRTTDYARGRRSLDREIKELENFLVFASRAGIISVVVDGNHDRMLRRWINENDWRKDEQNAVTYLKLALTALLFPERNVLDLAISGASGAVFLAPGETFQRCGIELSYHDIGPNGSRATRASLARTATKIVRGHSHSAGITDGVYDVGTCSKLRMDYNKRGPSSWSHTFCVIYKNGKRALITKKGSKCWL